MEIIPGLLAGIDRAKQSVKSGLGLLFDNPQEYGRLIAESARDVNRQDDLALQGKKAMLAGRQPTPDQVMAMQGMQRRAEDLAMGFAGSMKVMTPYELAHKVAQENAVKMLGLPPNNTAMDRARALGFDVEQSWYRGDKPNLSAFGDDGSNRISGNVFFASDKGVARRYAKTGKPYDVMNPPASEADGLYETIIRGGNQLNINAKNENWAEIPVPRSMRGKFFRGVGQIDEVADTAGKRGYDSLRVDNVIDQFGGGNQMVIFDPARIRSRAAAFDPARINDPDLLAAGIPLGLIAGTEIDLPKPEKKKPKKK